MIAKQKICNDLLMQAASLVAVATTWLSVAQKKIGLTRDTCRLNKWNSRLTERIDTIENRF